MYKINPSVGRLTSRDLSFFQWNKRTSLTFTSSASRVLARGREGRRGAAGPGEVDLGLSVEGGGEPGRGRGSTCVRRARKRLPPAHPERRGSKTPALQVAGRARAAAGCAGECGAAEPHRFAPAPRLARAAVLDRRESTLRHPLAAEPG